MSSHEAHGSSTTMPKTTKTFFQKLGRKKEKLSLNPPATERTGGTEDPTTSKTQTTHVVGKSYVKTDSQPVERPKLEVLNEQRPGTNITQTRRENVGNIQDLPSNRQSTIPQEKEKSTTAEFHSAKSPPMSRNVNNDALLQEIREKSKQLSQKEKSTAPLRRPPGPPPTLPKTLTPIDKPMKNTLMSTADTEDSSPKHTLQSSSPNEKKNSTSTGFPIKEAQRMSKDHTTTTGAAQPNEAKECSQQLPGKTKPKTLPKTPLSLTLSNSVTSTDKPTNSTVMDTVGTYNVTEDCPPNNTQSSSEVIKANRADTEFPSAEAQQKSRDENNAITCGNAISHEPKGSSQQLLERPKKPPRNPLPPTSKRQSSGDKLVNAIPMATGDTFIRTEESSVKQTLECSSPEKEVTNTTVDLSPTRTNCPPEMTKEVTPPPPLPPKIVTSVEKPKGSSQQAPERPKNPPPTSKRQSSKDKLVNAIPMATGDTFIRTEESSITQTLECSSPEKEVNSTTVDLSPTRTNCPPEMTKRVTPPPPPPPKIVTSVDKLVNDTQMATSRGSEDSSSKKTLQSSSQDKKENSKTKTVDLFSTRAKQKPSDENNPTISGDELLQESKKNCQKSPLRPTKENQKPSGENNTTTSGDELSHEPKENSQQPLVMTKPLESPPPSPLNLVTSSAISRGSKDSSPKETLQSSSQEKKENSTPVDLSSTRANQKPIGENNPTTSGDELSHKPKESTQKSPLLSTRANHKARREDNPTTTGDELSREPKKSSQQPPVMGKPMRPPPPPPPSSNMAKLVNASQLATSREPKDSPSINILQPSLHEVNFKVLVLSWESDHDATNKIAFLMGDRKPDCLCVALSRFTKDSEWTSLVDKSLTVIFYSTPKSQKPLYEMGRYLDYCITKKGPGKTIVVIGDVDNLKEEWTTKWEQSPFSKTLHQPFQISLAELDWISKKEIHEKIQNMRKSLNIHAGVPTNPAGKLQLQQRFQLKLKIKNNKGTKNNQTEKPQKSKQAIGLIFWLPKDDSQWLLKLLRSPYFQDTAGDIINIDGGNTKKEKIKEQIVNFPALILLFSQESFRTFSSQPNSKEEFWFYCEKRKVIVVIDDLDGESSEAAIRELYKNSGMESTELFLFRKEEKKSEYLTGLTRDKSDNKEAEKKLNLFQDLINRSMKRPDPPVSVPKLGTVGIFSRSSESDYDWLVKMLKYPKLPFAVDNVRPFYISNKRYTEFYEVVTHCNFGILYHTKNRGRVNITDVTDSLYDMEIEYLSTVLGRHNVLVVIDDLQDSSWEIKEQILRTQRSIPKYARNILLVTEEDKENERELVKKLTEAIVSPPVKEEGPWEDLQTPTYSTRPQTTNDDSNKSGNGTGPDTTTNRTFETDTKFERYTNSTSGDGNNPDISNGIHNPDTPNGGYKPDTPIDGNNPQMPTTFRCSRTQTDGEIPGRSNQPNDEDYTETML